MSHTHGPEDGRVICDLPTKKACEDRYADWQAMQQVLLAYTIAKGERVVMFSGRRGGKAILSQLIKVLIGEQDDIMNEDGNPSMAPWSVRLRAAIERVKAGDLPAYNLYRVDIGPEEGGTHATS